MGVIMLPEEVQGKPEIVQERTATAKVFDNGNGTKTAVISITPVHYQNERGAWQDIDLDILPDTSLNPYAWCNEKNGIKTYFKARAEEPDQVKVIMPSGNWFTWQPLGMVWRDAEGNEDPISDLIPTTGQVDKNVITYSEAYPDVDDQFRVDTWRLKHNIILKAKPRDPAALGEGVKLAFAGTIDYPDNVAPYVEGVEQSGNFRTSQAIEFRDRTTGELVHILPAPYAYEQDNPENFVCAGYEVNVSGSFVAFYIGVEETWLRDPERKFPIVIDPIVTIQPGSEGIDTYVDEGRYNQAFGGSTQLSVSVGGTGYDTWSLIRFDLSGLEYYANRITSAKLQLYAFKVYETTPGRLTEVPARPIAGSWNENVTWNNRPPVRNNITYVEQNFKKVNAWWQWDIIQFVKAWLQGIYPNYGICLQARVSINGVEVLFHSSDTPSVTYRPKLIINYEIGKNLLFTDGTAYFSDGQGEAIRYLDFGNILTGQNSSTKQVILENQCEFPVKDVQVWLEGTDLNDEVEISKTDNPFIAEPVVRFNGTFESGAEIGRFWMRVKAGETGKTSEGSKMFTIKAKAESLE